MSENVDWAQFALLLIDVQRDFWPEKLAELFPSFPDDVTRLLGFCRAQGIEIVHLRARFAADGSDWMPRYRLRGRIPCVQGTTGEEILPCALDRPGEPVFYKRTFDGFHHPDVLAHLKKGNKRFVLTAGLVTSTCVLFTTVSAAQLGLLTAVVEDCCADEPAAHQQTLDRYQFVFDRTTVDQIPERHAEWTAALGQLEQMSQADVAGGG